MDEAVLLWVNGTRTAALDPIVSFLTDWGLFAYLLVLAAWGAARRTRRDLETMRDGWLVFFVALFVSDTVLKPMIGRPRPSTIAALASQLHVLGRVPPPTSTSCPSGTAAACAGAAAWIWIRLGPRAGIPAALYALLVSLTRLYAGLHWPSDLVAGWLVGIAVALGIERLSGRVIPARA